MHCQPLIDPQFGTSIVCQLSCCPSCSLCLTLLCFWRKKKWSIGGRTLALSLMKCWKMRQRARSVAMMPSCQLAVRARRKAHPARHNLHDTLVLWMCQCKGEKGDRSASSEAANHCRSTMCSTQMRSCRGTRCTFQWIQDEYTFLYFYTSTAHCFFSLSLHCQSSV